MYYIHGHHVDNVQPIFRNRFSRRPYRPSYYYPSVYPTFNPVIANPVYVPDMDDSLEVDVWPPPRHAVITSPAGYYKTMYRRYGML